MASNFNWRDYIDLNPSRELSQDLQNSGRDPNLARLLPEDRAKVEKSLDEISSTPEGQELIKRAHQNATTRPGEKLQIIRNADGPSVAMKGTSPGFSLIALGDSERDIQWYSPETKKYHDFTTQHLLVHELNHMAHNHPPGIHYNSEKEAVEETNKYMKKYYNEPNRHEDATIIRRGGSPDFDIDPNFKPGGHTRQRRSDIGNDVIPGSETPRQVASADTTGLTGASSNITTKLDLGSAWQVAQDRQSPDPDPSQNMGPEVYRAPAVRQQNGLGLG